MDLLFKNPAYFIKTYFSFSPIGFLVSFAVFFIIIALSCRKRFKSRIGKWFFIILSSLYLATLVGVTLLNENRTETIVLHLNPLDNIRELFDDSMRVHQMRGCLSNIIFFIPFGVFGAIYYKKHKVVYSLLSGFLVSLIIETLQYALHRGCLETMDIICNTLGTLIGASITVLLIVLIYRKHKTKE